MNFKQLQDDLVERADDPGISVDSRKQWINDAYRELQTKADWSWMVTTATDTTVAGQQEYSLPTDLEKLIEVKVGSVAYTTRITYLDRNAYLSSERPHAYYLKGSATIGFVPVSDDSSTTITYTYKAAQAVLSEDDDTPAFSALYHEILVEGALARYWRREGNYAKSREHMANFSAIVIQMVANKTKPVVGELRRSRHIRDVYGD